LSDFLSEHLIYRDDDFMVIHKPSDILSVPKGDLHDSVLTRLVAIEPRTLLIHRLDRDTSGILVLGYRRGQSAIARQFQDRQTSKIYEALVAGHLEVKGQ
jgi:tRNA pseudouridine32 synthase/23S rRNA pseudouridine746 synthase